MKRIPLTQGKFALVDDADYAWLSKFRWHAHRDKNGVLWYAERTDRTRKPKLVKMHREILGTPKGLVVDHRNCDGLDNRRVNIHSCTIQENNTLRDKRLGKKQHTDKP